MNLQNLPEGFLYDTLPSFLIEEDEKSLLNAVLGGMQDRIDDTRSYLSRFELLYAAIGGLPQVNSEGQPNNNVVLATLQTNYGKVFVRSLDLKQDTPLDPISLQSWVRTQLNLPEGFTLLNAVIGFDPLRLIDANTLQLLAKTLGTVIISTAAQDTANSIYDAQRFLGTYFPRLKIKGTAKSFEALGRLLGWDDVKMEPLWGRLTPRLPEDVGNSVNDVDFYFEPDFLPQQSPSIFYDPYALRDGPFYSWSGTATAVYGTASSAFYENAINGLSPYFTVQTIGTVVDPDPGIYSLDNGAFQTFATAFPTVNGTSCGLQFTAIAPGEAFNGLQVNIAVDATGTNRILSVVDQLSSVKYRSSYFDLWLAIDADRALTQFGTITVQPSPDLASNPALVPLAGIAISPYRPWTAGSIQYPTTFRDYYASINPAGTPTVVLTPHQATLQNAQQDITNIPAAGAQTIQAMEEIRPATRSVRRAKYGFLYSDQIGYASYVKNSLLFTTAFNQTVYSGTASGYPLPEYALEISVNYQNSIEITWPSIPGYSYQVQGSSDFVNYANFSQKILATGTVTSSVVTPLGSLGVFRIQHYNQVGQPIGPFFQPITLQVLPPSSAVLTGELAFNGTQVFFTDAADTLVNGVYDLSSGTYRFSFVDPPSGAQIAANWIPTDTAVVRPNPADESLDIVSFQTRPEDQESGTLPGISRSEITQMADDVPWLRPIVAGGEIVDLDTYSPLFPDLNVTPVKNIISIYDQSGVAYDLLGLDTVEKPIRTVTQVKDAGCAPGQAAIAYSGNFLDLSQAVTNTWPQGQLSPTGFTNSYDDLDAVFQAGWSLYHAGVVQGVLVADPQKFYTAHHSNGLVGWFPLNEHPESALQVLDSSRIASLQTLAGISPDDRNYDGERGWYLNIPANASVASAGNREVDGNLTYSFWFAPETFASGTSVFFSFGKVDFSYCVNGGQQLVRFDLSNQPIGYFPVTPGELHFACFTAGTGADGNGTIAAGVSTLSNPLTVSYFGSAVPANLAGSGTLLIQGGIHGVGVSDFRIWNAPKSQSDLELVRYHDPTPTATLYRPGLFTVANNFDRYSLKVLPSGFLRAAHVPPWVRTPKLAYVERYNSMGNYTGDPRQKEVGLGGGQPLPKMFELGVQGHNDLQATGHSVVNPAFGAVPGINSVWQKSGTNSGYVVLPNKNQTPTGIVAQLNSTGTSVPWPNPQAAENPVRENIWLQGDDGFVYQVNLSVSKADNVLTPLFQAQLTALRLSASELAFSGTNFSASDLAQLSYSSQPTGAVSQLSGTNPFGTGGSLAVGWGGTSVYVAPYAGTETTPPLFVCANSIAVELGEVWSNPNSFGLAHPPAIAAIQNNGEIEFDCQGAGTGAPVSTGNCRLTVVSGNIGQADPNFEAFNAVIAVADASFPAKLCLGLSGANFIGTNTFDFVMPGPVAGVWPLVVNWSNAFADPLRGYARQLAIYSIGLEELQTNIFQGSLSNGTNFGWTALPTSAFSGVTPGAWVETINSYGSVAMWQHESQIYPSNDTVSSPFPVSAILASTTGAKTEDILVSGSIVLPDPVPPALPTFGAITVS